MKDSSGDDNHGGSVDSIRRRGVLAAVGVASFHGLSGCSSDVVGGDGGSDDDSDGDDGASGDLGCTDVTNEYEQQDVGSRPFVFDFEYPALFGELEFVQGPSVVFYNGSYSTGDATIDLQIQQVTDPEQSIGDEPGGTSGTTTTFNGEEVEFFGVSSGSGVFWLGDLPYQIDGQRETLATVVSLSYSGDGSNACGDALREAAEHIVTSMEVNGETTVGVDGSGSDSGEDDDDDEATGGVGCTAVTNGYERLDVGARPFIFDFDYPAMFDELEFVQGPTAVFYNGDRSSGDVTIDISIQQVTDPEQSMGEDPEGTAGVTTTFNGEEVEFFGLSSGSGVFWTGDLPYQYEGQRETFTTVVSLSVSSEGSNACGDALREAAEHLVTSMEVNGETTIEE